MTIAKLVRLEGLRKFIPVSRQTIENWTKRGMPRLKIEGTILFDVDEVKKWVRENSQ